MFNHILEKNLWPKCKSCKWYYMGYLEVFQVLEMVMKRNTGNQQNEDWQGKATASITFFTEVLQGLPWN